MASHQKEKKANHNHKEVVFENSVKDPLEGQKYTGSQCFQMQYSSQRFKSLDVSHKVTPISKHSRPSHCLLCSAYPCSYKLAQRSYILKTEVQKAILKRHASWLARLSLAAWGSARAHVTNCLILCWTRGSGASVPLTTAEGQSAAF